MNLHLHFNLERREEIKVIVNLDPKSIGVIVVRHVHPRQLNLKTKLNSDKTREEMINIEIRDEKTKSERE